MKTKSILLIQCLLMLMATSANAQLQRFSVADFASTPSDMTARDEQYKKTDDNGTLYAIIKVTSDQPNDDLKSFRFDFGLMNSFTVPHPEKKELWVYVQKNARTVTISRDGYVSVSKYDLGQTIRAGNTYKMTLKVIRNTASEQSPSHSTGSLAIVSHPVGANIKIDGKDYGKTPCNIRNLSVGRHTLSLMLDKYKKYTKPFEIQENKITEMNVELEQVYVDRQKELSFTVEGNGKNVTFIMRPVEADTTVQVGGDSFVNYPATLSNDYFIGETEVTQALWTAVMGKSPIIEEGREPKNRWESAYGIGDNIPAYNVNYSDIQSFLAALNKLTGKQFRLPTNAEWEFAARGGKKSRNYIYAGSNKKGNMWFRENSDNRLHDVKGKNPNELGLYDMSGNVSEAVVDVKDRRVKAAYGGRYDGLDSYCLVNSISYFEGSSRSSGVGFRLAMNPINQPPVKLSVTSKPSGTNIKIDGKNYGKTPKTIPNLPAGHHVVEFSAIGYFTESMEIEAFKNDKINMELDHTCPDSRHPHAVDMGTGVKWACCNVGAQKPADDGEHYTWKEIVITGTWRLPTREEQEALCNNCSWTLTYVDGIEGYKVKAPNGNCIFLPISKEGKQGYWSSSFNKEYNDKYSAKGIINNFLLWCKVGDHSVSDRLLETKDKALTRPVAK